MSDASATSGVIVCSNPQELNAKAAALFTGAAEEALSARSQFMVALSGGNTPKALYQLLSAPPWNARVDWRRTHLFFGDERMVLPGDANSNYHMVFEALLSGVETPKSNVHRVRTECGEPARVAAEYERTIRSVFGIAAPEIPRFDFVLLGLGENGHTASLFPHSKVLREPRRLVAADFVETLRAWRVSMTAPLLNQARQVVFLVAGAGKAAVLRDVVAGPQNPDALPAQLIRPADGSLIWLVDAAAGQFLPGNVARSA
jgi:6-phosphogluconolactonase